LNLSLANTQVAGAHIPGTVDALLDPEAPLALRLSGQLLLGVVRVYSRQLSFLQQVGYSSIKPFCGKGGLPITGRVS
jgi:cohesin complex subunit SCC1